jgi:hypothetical protein
VTTEMAQWEHSNISVKQTFLLTQHFTYSSLNCNEIMTAALLFTGMSKYYRYCVTKIFIMLVLPSNEII